MFAIHESLTAEGAFFGVSEPEERRYYRGRNDLAVTGIDWNTGAQIPVDPPDWDDMVRSSLRVGMSAARKTFKPALVVWSAMIGIALLYYLVPATQGVFAAITALQDQMGVYFASIGMGLSVGILVECVKVMISPEKRWNRANTINAIFNFVVFGVMGITQYYRYAWQIEVFGAGNSFRELASKVLFDQFVWTVLFANPYQAILFLWKNTGFSWKSVGKLVFPLRVFWGTQMLPVLISNWAFWIPMAFLVYYFPAELQVPMAILAVSIWVILLSSLTSATRHEDS
ncbi:hypothetical protein V2O64_25635 (plasmid) [Verrucomicrobiaceae bacterium 227]